jgi:hypothetical protein
MAPIGASRKSPIGKDSAIFLQKIDFCLRDGRMGHMSLMQPIMARMLPKAAAIGDRR